MSKVRHAFFLQIAGFLIVVALLVWASQKFPLLAWIAAAQVWMADQGAMGALLYPFLFGLCNVLLLPAGILALGAGFFFGLWGGFFLLFCGSVLGAAMAFVISRTLLRGWIESRMLRSPRLRALDAAMHKEGWRVVVLSQLHPLFPTSLLMYFYGMTRLPFFRCMLWVAIGQSPRLFLFAYLGTLGQIGMDLWRGEGGADAGNLPYPIWIGGLVLTLGIFYFLARMAQRLLKSIQNAEVPPEPES